MKLRIGFDSARDIVVAFMEQDGECRSFYRSRHSDKFSGFGNDKIAYNSITRELTEEQIQIIFNVIEELLNDI